MKKLFPTEKGAPQGSPISPVICNMVLDGLQPLLRKNFHQVSRNGGKYPPKVNFVRFADDFIITGENRELLEEQVLPVVRQFMAERGLQLSEEKTVITHIDDGFDFLGCNIRKYKGKLLIKPSKKNINGKCFVTEKQLEIGDMHCHHKTPYYKTKDDSYSNLVLVTTDVHRLLHAAKPETIKAYMDMLKPDKKQMAKINRLRKMLDLPSI